MAGEIITNFQPVEEKKLITTDFRPVSGLKGEIPEEGLGETYLTQGRSQLTVVDKIMDYLGIQPATRRKTTPLELEAIETKTTPFQVREDIFGTGKEVEMRKVLQRGLSGASGSMTDLISKYLTGEVERPETIPGTLAGAGMELIGFLAGPIQAARLITGTRLIPTAVGLKGVAQMMKAGAATLGIASGLSSIIPSLMESESLTDAGVRVGKSTGVGALIGAIFPTFGLVPTKSLRVAVGLAVMDKIRAGTNEWFTIDDVVMGIYNGDIDKKELATKAYEFLIDLYFTLQVPSMGKQLEGLKQNKALRELTKELNKDEVEKTIIDLEKTGLIPGSEKREVSKIDEQIIDLTDVVEEGPISRVIGERLARGESVEDLKQQLILPTPEKIAEIDQKIAEQEAKIEGLKLKEEVGEGKVLKVKPVTELSKEPLGEELEGTIRELRGIIKVGEAGGVIGGGLEGAGRYGSSMKIQQLLGGMSAGKEETLKAIDKGLKGEKLGVRQQEIFNKIKEAANGIIEDRIETLSKSIDDEIMGWKEELRGEGISEENINRAVEEATKYYQEEGRSPDLEAIKKELFPEPVREVLPELEKPVLSPTAKDQFALPGIKQGLEMKGGKEVTPTLEGTPLGEAARKTEVEKAQPSIFGEKKAPSGLASIDRYRESLPTIMDLPEIVKLAHELLGGKYPEIREKLRALKGAALGVFWPGGEGKIGLKAELFKDIEQAKWTTAHEIGHLVDYLPDDVVARGNILGRIATLKKYLKEIIEEAPPSLEHWLLGEEGQKEWKKIRTKIRKEARKEAIGEGIDPKEDKEMFNDFVSGRYAELKAEWIEESSFISKQEIMDELKSLTQAIKPFEPIPGDAYTKYRYKSAELYADAMSALVNNPYLLKEHSPKFYDAFFNYLERKPEVKRVYEELQDAIRSGTIHADRVKELRESFRKGDEKYYESIRKEKGIIDDVKTALIDRNNFIIQKIKNVGEKNLAPGENPRYKIEEMDYRVSQDEAYVTDIYSKVVRPMEKVGASWEDFREWTFHQRIINERGEIANPMGWYPKRSQERVAEMEKNNPTQLATIKEAHDAFWEIRQEFFINRAKLLNIFSKETMEKIENTEFYATFDLQEHFNDAYGRTTGPKIYHQIGTLQEIGDPIVATMMKDISLMNSMSRIKAARTVIEFFKKYYPDEIKEADTVWTGKGRTAVESKEAGQYLLFDMQEGKANGYYLPEEVGNTFENNVGQAGTIARILRKTVQPFRIVFTEINYGFWMFNIHRDFFRAAKNLPDATITNFAKYWIEGLKPAFRETFGVPNDVVREMLKENMLISISDTRGMRPEDMQIERLLKKYHIVENEWNNKILKPFGSFFNFMTNIGRALERTTKIGSYEYLKEKFPDMSTEEIGHIVRSLGGSPDFLRKGTGYDVYNNILLFSNAIKEGYRGDYEAFSNSPGQFSWKTAKYNFMPKLLMKAAAIGLLGYGFKEMMDKVTDYDKTNYHIIPIGLTPSGKAIYFRIPQDETGRFFGGILWKVMDESFNPMKGGLIDYMSGQAPTIHPGLDVLVDVVEYYSGNNPYDSFRGRYAIPDLVWKAQDFRTTEAFAKYIANKSGVGLVHRFRSDNDVEIKTELEKIIGYPILSNILGRFIKVSDYGEKEHIKKDILEPIRKERAREILDVQEAVQKLVTGKPLTDKDRSAIISEEMRDWGTGGRGGTVITKNLIVNLGRRYGSAYTEAFLSASTKEEKLAILKELMKKQALKQGGSK